MPKSLLIPALLFTGFLDGIFLMIKAQQNTAAKNLNQR
jgi:hypothetical protein